MTTLGLIRVNLRVYAIFILFFCGLGTVFYVFVSPLAAAFVAVVAISCLLRDIGYFRRAARSWPLLQWVIDWEKVSELLKDEKAFASPRERE